GPEDHATEGERRARVDGVDGAVGAGDQEEVVGQGACGQAVVLEVPAGEGHNAGAEGVVVADYDVAHVANKAGARGDRDAAAPVGVVAADQQRAFTVLDQGTDTADDARHGEIDAGGHTQCVSAEEVHGTGQGDIAATAGIGGGPTGDDGVG